MRRLVTARFPGIVFALAALLVLFPGGWSTAGTDDPLRIGVLAPLSGPFASGGSAFLQAVTRAAEQANTEGGVLGRRVELLVADTQGRVDIARSEAMRLISREKVFALVGAYLSEATGGGSEGAAAGNAGGVVPVAP